MDIENVKLTLEAEKADALIKLKNQIQSVKNTICYLEEKIENNEVIYDSDGLQASGI